MAANIIEDFTQFERAGIQASNLCAGSVVHTKTFLQDNGRKAIKKLRVVVVGCGLGGLAAAYALGRAGHHITILESSPFIGDIGAGIQVCPNLSRILIRWGLGSRLRNDTGEVIGMSRLEGKLDRNHGAPWYTLHRADLHGMLYSIAAPYMNLRLNSKVVALHTENQDRPSVTLHTGEVIFADLIIGADGINSTMRNYVIGQKNIPLSIPTGDVAYRVVLPTDTFGDDAELKALIEEPKITCWIGPERHVVGYCIRERKEYNMVLIKPGDGHPYSWTAEGDPNEMRDGFTGWDPCLQKLLARANEVLESKLLICEPLDTWIHPSGRVVLMGDSCHPMLPYRAQGSAMAIEDAVVLGSLFSRITHRSQIPHLLKAYERLRHPRVTATQAASAKNRDIYHVPYGTAEQERRDTAMKEAMALELSSYEEWIRNGQREPFRSSSVAGNQWADAKKNDQQFNYDPELAVERWWDAEGVDIVQSKL
ncbi:hypothetical protein BDP27DRAFT_1385923 [Rhodocollybia butyracea]|uniref:FAD-binding domain-containing protein n=1 Tax=Rhodocollybia butyracea TaxID=206335 RepID=A0A9P5TZ24_9AGAR|nr:hypothetical protein BDP27DRAFT_1385923 [Rhodocollybia butyracea]